MKLKLEDLQRTRDQLIARQKSAQAQAQVQDAVRSIDLLDPTSEVARFEEKIRREEARVAGRGELAASSLDAQFETLEDDAVDADVEARLSKLKVSSRPPRSSGRSAGARWCGTRCTAPCAWLDRWRRRTRADWYARPAATCA